jgi:hypothetical protein
LFERVAPIEERALQYCPVRGQSSAKVPFRISLGGHADAGLSREQMPQTWRGSYEGNAEYLGQLRGHRGLGRSWKRSTPSFVATSAQYWRTRGGFAVPGRLLEVFLDTPPILRYSALMGG